MLGELRCIHGLLREAIAELAAVASNSVLDEAPLSTARLRLSRASRNRRSLILGSIAPLLHDVPAPKAADVAALVLEDSRLMINSSEHVRRWTMSGIRDDWTGYQRASAEMRASMLKRIDREAAVLYPLLESKAGKRAA